MSNGYIFDEGFKQLRRNMNEAFAEEHGKRVAERERVNGQPNGYRPITEAELQAKKLEAEKFRLAVEALEGDTRRQASLKRAASILGSPKSFIKKTAA